MKQTCLSFVCQSGDLLVLAWTVFALVCWIYPFYWPVLSWPGHHRQDSDLDLSETQPVVRSELRDHIKNCGAAVYQGPGKMYPEEGWSLLRALQQLPELRAMCGVYDGQPL